MNLRRTRSPQTASAESLPLRRRGPASAAAPALGSTPIPGCPRASRHRAAGAVPIPWRRSGRRRSCRCCHSALKISSDSLLMVSAPCGADDASLEEITFPAAIYLAFDELQLCDLSLGLAVRPG